MTEYKVGLGSLFNYLPVYLIEGGLIYVSTLTENFKWIMISLTGVILLVTLGFTILHVFRKYQFTDEGIVIYLSEKRNKLIKYEDIITVTKNRRSFEVGYKHKEKMKTIYFGWYIRNYRKLEVDFINRVQKTSQYEKIIFVN